MNFKDRMEQHMPSIRDVLRRRSIKFGAVGFSGTIINLTALYLNQEFLFRWVESAETRLSLSLATAMFLATLSNFVWNRGWTWEDRKEESGHGFFFQMGQYFLASGFAIGIQYLGTMALSKVAHYMLANLLSIVMAALLNYFVNDLWTFAARKKSRTTGRLKVTSI